MTETDVHDVVIVGAGATGLWAAKPIVDAGRRVLLLDAGPRGDMASRREEASGSDLVRRLAVSPDDHPYAAQPDKPFRWYGRVRAVGGRMNVWAGGCLRMSDARMVAPLAPSGISIVTDEFESVDSLTTPTFGSESYA